jgi:hypothetical protein
MAQAKTFEKKIRVSTKTGGTTVSLGTNGKGAMLGYGAKGRK